MTASESWEPNSALLSSLASNSPEWPYGRIRIRSVARIGEDYGLSDGDVYRVQAEPEDGDSISFVVKREGAEQTERALRFHRSVGPRVPGSIAALHGGIVDPETDTGVLALEDVAPAAQGDVLAGCTDSQALAAVQGLARVHAASRVAIAEGVAEGVPLWQFAATTVDEWEIRLSEASARFPETLTAALVRRLHDLPRRVESATASLRRCDACWINGDAHLDNVLFRPDGTAVLLDWSGAVIGPAAVDLARLLTEGVNAGAEPRRAPELLAVYGAELGVDADAILGDPWRALSDGLAPLVQLAIRWAARDEARAPRGRMRALQENLLRSVCAWASNERLTGPGRIFAPECGSALDEAERGTA